MFDVDNVIRPWYDRIAADVAGLTLYDAHTHIGRNDPDGFKQTPEELMGVLERAGARAVTFPSHEPGGYPDANDAAIDAARASGGRIVAYCRVDPHAGALREATRCLDAGARGIKLHPRAERFTLAEPAVRDVVALAHERRVPVLIHAGRGIPALGRDTVRLSGQFSGASLILAHGAISDLAWLWKVMPEHSNLFIDTAWWNPADLIALFTLVAPSQVLFASDSPYGITLNSAVISLRCALQAGLDPDQIRLVAGGQLERVLAGEEPADGGPPPNRVLPLDPHHDRVVTHLVSGLGRAFAGGDPDEPIALARLACAVGEDDPQAAHFASVLRLLDLFAEHLAPPVDGRPLPAAARLLVAALAVARTPDVPVPVLDEAPAPTRSEAERAA
jgi:predicted TIM-barrel fold metal-dependent hydrolase